LNGRYKFFWNVEKGVKITALLFCLVFFQLSLSAVSCACLSQFAALNSFFYFIEIVFGPSSLPGSAGQWLQRSDPRNANRQSIFGQHSSRIGFYCFEASRTGISSLELILNLFLSIFF
jgi:hypothetical protein